MLRKVHRPPVSDFVVEESNSGLEAECPYMVVPQEEESNEGNIICVYAIENEEDTLFSVESNDQPVLDIEDEVPKNTPETIIHIEIQNNELENMKEIIKAYRCKKCSFLAADEDGIDKHCISHLLHKENNSLANKVEESDNNDSDNNSDVADDLTIEIISFNKDRENNANPSKKKVFAEKKKKRNNIEILGNIDSTLISSQTFACSHCKIKFNLKKDLEIHERCHVLKTGQNKLKRSRYMFQCFVCQSNFSSWSHCTVHLYKIHLIECNILTCPVCKEYKTPVALRLENHMRVHSDVRAFICHHCDKTFKQAAQLRNHSLVHESKQKADFTPKQCNICFKMYSDAKSLKKHKEEVHFKLRPYVCNVCGHASARKAMLIMHQRQHNGAKPYECSTCSYKTADHNSYRKHMMKHSDVRPYKCRHPGCEYKAIQSGSLKNHVKLKHPNQGATYNCTICGYISISEDNYTRHVSDHLTGTIKDKNESELRSKVEYSLFPEETNVAKEDIKGVPQGGASNERVSLINDNIK